MRDSRVFVDSNVILYLHDVHDPDRGAVSRFWLETASLQKAAVTNLQVLNEVANVLLKRKNLSDKQVFTIVDDLAYLGATPLTWSIVVAARDIRLSTRYAWWDCVLLASALELRCSHFLSEDLQDGHKLAGMTIVDPFKHSPELIFGARN